MELDDGSKDVVHPEVRAHINSLVSAVRCVAFCAPPLQRRLGQQLTG